MALMQHGKSQMNSYLLLKAISEKRSLLWCSQLAPISSHLPFGCSVSTEYPFPTFTRPQEETGIQLEPSKQEMQAVLAGTVHSLNLRARNFKAVGFGPHISLRHGLTLLKRRAILSVAQRKRLKNLSSAKQYERRIFFASSLTRWRRARLMQPSLSTITGFLRTSPPRKLLLLSFQRRFTTLMAQKLQRLQDNLLSELFTASKVQKQTSSSSSQISQCEVLNSIQPVMAKASIKSFGSFTLELPGQDTP